MLIQGGGGNTSVKTADGEFMYIKASGTALRDMNAKTGWRRLKLETVLSIVKDKKIACRDVYSREIEVVRQLRLACDDNVGGTVRPSIESHLHAMLGKFVIHLHPAAVLSYACAKNGEHKLKKLFKDEKFPVVWVRYADPGFMLARRLRNLIDDYQKQFGSKPTILFLEKHGLLISAKSSSAALKLVGRVIRRCNGELIKFKAVKSKTVDSLAVANARGCIRQAVAKVTGQKPFVQYFYDRDIAAFLANPKSKKLLSFPALTPDELLYTNGPAMWLGECVPEQIESKLSRQIEKGIRPATAFLVKDVGLFVTGAKKMIPAISEIVRNSFFIRLNANRLGGISCLNKRQHEFIYNWEADAFRKKIAEG